VDAKAQPIRKDQLDHAAMINGSGRWLRNFDFNELGGSLWLDGLGFTPPIEKSLVAELMLPTECGSTESGLIKLCEPVFALLLGKSSRRHARQNISIEPFEEIIHMGLLGPLQAC